MKWTDKEIEYLKDTYPNLSIKPEEMSKKLNRNYVTIVGTASRFNIKRKYNNIWTKEEIQFLRDNYIDGSISLEYIGRKINRGIPAIGKKASSLGLRRTKWQTKEKLQLIKENYLNSEITLEEISKKLGCTIATIIRIATQQLNLGLRKPYWTEKESQYVKDNYSKKDVDLEKMSKELGKSVFAIIARATVLDIHKHDKYRKKHWLEEEIQYVGDNYTNLDMSVKQMAKKLNRSFNAVCYKAKELGLKRDKKEVDEKGICDLYKKGYSIGEICESFNTSSWTVDRIFRENNIFPKRGASRRGIIKGSATRQNISIEEWTGFKSTISRRIRVFLEYKEWRKEVYKRDNYTCQECGERGGRLHAHHKVSVSEILKKVDLSLPIEKLKTYLRKETILYSVRNGETVCLDCHAIFHPNIKNLIFRK